MLKTLKIILVTGILLGLGYYLSVRYVQQIPLNLSADIHTVAPGSSALRLCRQWQQQALLSESQCLMLRLYLKLHPEDAGLAALQIAQLLWALRNSCKKPFS